MTGETNTYADPWEVTFTATPGQLACKHCRASLSWPARPLGWVPPIDCGHDPQGHRLTGVLRRARFTSVEAAAALPDAELLMLRNMGQKTLARLREIVREHPPT